MIILASEDIGLADPGALQVVISCASAFERIGFPEGNYPLAHACLYLATAPKSNSVMAFFDALKEVEKEDAEVPNHLREPSRDSESFGHGDGYIYPHAYRDHWAAQQYLPTALRGKTFYVPSAMGYEAERRETVLRRREVQAAVVLGDGKHEETLTWSAASKGREGWFKRLAGGRSALLLSDRERILEQRAIERHSRILIPNADDGLLLWEALRRAPEGLVAALVSSEAAKNALLSYSAAINGGASLDESEQALFAVGSRLPPPEEASRAFSCRSFDYLFAREPFKGGATSAAFASFATAANALLAPRGAIVLLQSPPASGERISRILKTECGADAALFTALAEAEQTFFAGNERLSWTAETLKASFSAAGFTVASSAIDQKEDRLITNRDIALWFDREKSSWGAFIADAIGSAAFSTARSLLHNRAQQGPLDWRWKSVLLTASL
jgi:putative ATPase